MAYIALELDKPSEGTLAVFALGPSMFLRTGATLAQLRERTGLLNPRPSPMKSKDASPLPFVTEDFNFIC